MSDIKERTCWQIKNNHEITVLVLDVTDDVIEFTEERRIFRLSKFLFLQCFEEQGDECYRHGKPATTLQR